MGTRAWLRVVLAASGAWAAAAEAAPVTWHLQDVAFADGATATFPAMIYDASLPDHHSEVGATTLHSFDRDDAWQPLAALVRGCDGARYGTTSAGGANSPGTVFHIRPNGSFQILFSFSSLNGGGFSPRAPLVQAGDGNFQGTTLRNERRAES